MNVLDFYCRLINKDTNGESQSPQCHDVDRLTGCPQKHDSRKQREGDIHHNNECAAPVAKENQHHQAGQYGAEQAFGH